MTSVCEKAKYYYIKTLRKILKLWRINIGNPASIILIILALRRLYKFLNLSILPFIFLSLFVCPSFHLSTLHKLPIMLLAIVLLSFLLNNILLVHVPSSLNTLTLTRSYSLNIHNPRCAILARVSTLKQAKENLSIPTQIDVLEELAKERGMFVVKVLTEEGRSGRDFSRDAIWEVLDLARRGEIDYLLVLDLDRVGRDTIWVIVFSGILFLLGVKILTPEREYDLKDLPDLLLMVVKSYAAEEEAKKIGERTKRGKVAKFKQKKWVKGSVDFGYMMDGEWPKKDERYEQLIRDVFEIFLKTTNFSLASQKVEDMYGVKLSPSKVKRILTNPIYCGRPQYAGVTIEDPSLAFIDIETFERVQKIIGRQKDKKKGEAHNKSLQNARRLAEEIGLLNATKIVPELRYCCPDCEVPLVCNGTKNVRGRRVPVFKCPKCKRQFEDPLWKRRNELKNTVYFICDCWSLENIKVEQISEREWKYTCRTCGFQYITDAPPDPYLRFFKAKKKSLKILVRKYKDQTTLDYYHSG